MKDQSSTYKTIPSFVILIFAVGEIVVVDNSFLQHTTHTTDLSFFSLPPFSRTKYLTRIAYVSCTTIQIPSPRRYHSTICCTYEPMADTQETTASRTHNNTQHTTENINTVTMVPPSRRLPAAPILQVSAIAVPRVIDHNHCNTAMYFLLMTPTFLLFILLLF